MGILQVYFTSTRQFTIVLVPVKHTLAYGCVYITYLHCELRIQPQQTATANALCVFIHISTCTNIDGYRIAAILIAPKLTYNVSPIIILSHMQYVYFSHCSFLSCTHCTKMDICYKSNGYPFVYAVFTFFFFVIFNEEYCRWSMFIFCSMISRDTHSLSYVSLYFCQDFTCPR